MTETKKGKAVRLETTLWAIYQLCEDALSFCNPSPGKNAAAVSLARLRARKLTPEQRSASARTAGKARMTSMTREQRVAVAKLGGRPRKQAKLKARRKP
jgi:hypothetical protein